MNSDLKFIYLSSLIDKYIKRFFMMNIVEIEKINHYTYINDLFILK